MSRKRKTSKVNQPLRSYDEAVFQKHKEDSMEINIDGEWICPDCGCAVREIEGVRNGHIFVCDNCYKRVPRPA